MKHFIFSILFLLVFSVACEAQNTQKTLKDEFNELLPKLDCTDLTDKDKVKLQEQANEAFQKMAFRVSTDEKQKAEFNALIVDALGKGQPALTQVWLLRQLQWTGTAREVPAVAACLNQSISFVVDEAAATLCKIPGPEALAALKAAEEKASGKDKAVLKGALQNRTEDLTVGTETIMPLAIPYVDKATLDKWLTDWDKFDENTKVQTLAGLCDRKDKSYLPLVTAAIKGNSEAVKLAGILALEKLCTPAELPLLLNYSNRTLVERIATYIEADGIDEALVKILSSEKNQERSKLITGILANRNVDISSIIFKKATMKDCTDRVDLLRQAQNLSGKEKIADFISVMILCDAGKQREEAEKIIAATVNGDASGVISCMKNYPETALYSVLGRIGGNKVKDILFSAAHNTSNVKAREEAIRAMCNWPDAQIADQLFELAQNKSDVWGEVSHPLQVAALRAFIRVISLPDEKIGIKITAAEKLAALEKAYNASTRLEEKKLILSRLGAIREVASLDFALKHVNEKELSEAVYNAIADLAHHNALRKSDMAKFGPAMDMVIQNSKDTGLIDRVKRYKDQK